MFAEQVSVGTPTMDLENGDLVVDVRVTELFQGMIKPDDRVVLDKLKTILGCDRCPLDRASLVMRSLSTSQSRDTDNEITFYETTAHCDRHRAHLQEMARRAPKDREYISTCLSRLDLKSELLQPTK
jgi:hypothetical protein